MSAEIKMITLTEQQFNTLIDDRQESKRREERVLELAEGLQQEKIKLMAGLVHFTREEVAELFHCSTRQLQQYEKEGKLVSTRIVGKVLYSVETLLAFVNACKEPELGALIQQRASSSYPTRKQRVLANA